MTMSMKKGENKKKEKTSPSLVCDFLFGHADKVTNFVPTLAINLVVVFRRFQAGKRQCPYFPSSLSLALSSKHAKVSHATIRCR